MNRAEDMQRGRPRHTGAGFTIVELCIAMVILCMMATLAVPIFRKSVEQARADVASANLKILWSAQRIYWLENRCYASRLADLRAMDLIDAAMADSPGNPQAVYVYAISSANASAFTAGAMRNASGAWAGQLQIDQEGKISGTIISRSGETVNPTQ